MIWKFAPLALVGFVAACGGNPLSFDGPPVEPPAVEPPEIDEPAPITGVQVPAVIAHNLRSATYSPNATTAASNIRIDLVSHDGTPVAAAYDRAVDYDVPGYEAFTIQESNSNRVFVAMFKRADSAEGGVVGDGGQFGKYLAGATYRQLQPFTLPTPASLGRASLLATYTGGYVGLLNTGPDVVHPGNPFDPSLPLQVSGEFMMNADFNAENMQIEGGVRDRVVKNLASGLNVRTLDPVFFSITQITPEGAFSGNVTYAPDPKTSLGHYSGVIGGQGTSIAGGTNFTPDPINNPDLHEHGAFVGNVCPTPTPGSASPCPTWYR